MIIDAEHDYIFVHVPKTGGTAITQALQPHVRVGCVNATGHMKHWSAKRIFKEFFHGDAQKWNRYRRVAVMRNPYELIHSDYYFCLRHVPRIPEIIAEQSRNIWVKKLERVRDTYHNFEQFARAEYLRDGCTIWQHYATDGDGNELVNYVIRYELLRQLWPDITLTLIGKEIELPTINVTLDRPPYQDDYTPELQDAVRRHFADELLRFGYGFYGE